MKHSLMIFTAAVAGVVSFGGSLQANSFSGSITLTGNYTDTPVGNVSSASSVSPNSLSVSAFQGVFNGSSHINANSFGTINLSLPTSLEGKPVWRITVASLGVTKQYSFTVISEYLSLPSGGVDLSGIGTFSDGNPADNTPGTYTLDFLDTPVNGNDETFTFSTGVPDAASTAMLLGSALSAVALLRKKLVA